MKTIIFLISFLMSTCALASGKITYKQIYNFDTKKYDMMVGLSVYQKLYWKLAYNGWTGMGEPRRDIEGNWYITKHAIDLNISRFTVSVGGELFYYRPEKEWDKGVFGSVSFRLWD